MKKCWKCKKTKELNCFNKDSSRKDGYNCLCKECIKKYNLLNKDNIKKKKKEFYQKNKERIILRQKKYYIQHREEIIAYKKDYRKKYPEKRIEVDRKYYKSHYFLPQYKERKNKYARFRMNNNPQYRIAQNVSRLIYKAIKEKKQGLSWESLVGYNLDKLKQRLSLNFQDGMTWLNYGKWHIDHKKPRSLFNYNSFDSQSFKDCWSLANLQPLWAKDNIKKSNKFN